MENWKEKKKIIKKNRVIGVHTQGQNGHKSSVCLVSH